MLRRNRQGHHLYWNLRITAFCLPICSNHARYIFVTTKNKTFKTHGSGAISAHEFVRHMKSAWNETSCANDTKINMIVDKVTDRIRQLLRIYEPSDDPHEMLPAVVKLVVSVPLELTFYPTVLASLLIFSVFTWVSSSECAKSAESSAKSKSTSRVARSQ